MNTSYDTAVALCISNARGTTAVERGEEMKNGGERPKLRYPKLAEGQCMYHAKSRDHVPGRLAGVLAPSITI